MPGERVSENVNRALHTLFADDPRLYLLGEDVLDPYGGAFRVTRGLSTAYPDRVLTTPLSESGIIGVANGLALAGNRAIVEVMFGDFLMLGFDQLVNFAAKSVAMYGRPVAMPVVVRCPVGGNRGYGPTHSQSPQKHLIGVPHLTLFEMSPLHDAQHLLRAALASGGPSVFFEDKVLYTRRQFTGGRIDERYEYRELPGPGDWVQVGLAGLPSPDVVLVVGGGMVHRALEAVRVLRDRDRLTVTMLVPGQIYPLDTTAIEPLVEASGLVCVAEEGSHGGTWGAEVATQLYRRVWTRLAAPVELVASRASVIPAAPHLERDVLTQAGSIIEAVAALAHATRRPAPVAGQHFDGLVVTPAPAAVGREIVVPTLNTNDESCVLIDWLVDDGDFVDAGTSVATVETSKATSDIEVAYPGVIRRLRKIGEEVRFGEAIGHVVDDRAVPVASPPATSMPVASPSARNQAAVAAAVTASHRTIPVAFGAIEVDLTAATTFLDVLSERAGAAIDLSTLIVKAVAALHGEFPGIFVNVTGSGDVTPMPADIGVTMDAGAGLFVPVVKGALRRDFTDVADELVEYRMNALDGRFAEQQLTGAAVSISLNLVEGVTLVQPLILPPQAAMVSVAGPQRRLARSRDGHVVDVAYATFGLAYDHRVINGREATEFLSMLKALLEDPSRLALD